MTLLSTEHLSIGYRLPRQPVQQVVTDITVSLVAGELVALLGPNGAGKSTLLRTLAGMQPPLSGHIWLAGLDLVTLSPRQLARHLSIVLTERVDAGALTAYELVALGRHPYTNWTGHLTPADNAVIQEALVATGAAAHARRPVNTLSDGERQKVMIARALAQQPQVMLLDEPTAFLDLPRRVELMQLLRRLAHDQGQAIIFSTHDLDLALRSADTVWLLPAGGPLHVGVPEALVLDGTFEAAFQREGVTFDATTGSFTVNHRSGPMVGVVGAGLATVWTVRALERLGWQVVRDPVTQLPMQVTVTPDCWQVATSQGTTAYPTLTALLTALQPHHHGDNTL